ncbi:MAG: FecR family protein [Pseudobacter sp.]|uniref:FecR family protein n=1 Tax=Pseudobacter sp. TaxID=2045420 RepID=UPI003F801B84
MYRIKQEQPVTEAEQAQLESWLQRSTGNRQLFNNLMDDRFVMDNLKEMKQWDIPAFSAALVQKIREQEKPAPVRTLQSPWFRRIAVAATVLLIAGATWFILRPSPEKGNPAPATIVSIEGASNKARLTLADGSVIELDTLKNGSIAAVAGNNIQKSNDQLIYNNAGEASTNTLTTPRGGKFRLTLPDGTKVWMNSASSLTYPTAFNGKSRTVDLTGEAYFEVARNPKQPFTVNIQDLKVNVTGTHFNVNGYEDEGQVLTTLVEGGVQVQRQQQAQALKPGQQAIAQQKANTITVSNANIKQVLAWKDGLFIFDGKQKSEILRELSRWYDI